MRIERRKASADACEVPQETGIPARVCVDPAWGDVQPISLHPEIETVGELEVIAHLEAGGLAIDTRKPDFVEQSGTIPGAQTVPWEEIADSTEIAEASGEVILFCNGPQCAATPRAVDGLLGSGFPARRLRYYRGGIHDWVTLGFPLEPPP